MPETTEQVVVLAAAASAPSPEKEVWGDAGGTGAGCAEPAAERRAARAAGGRPGGAGQTGWSPAPLGASGAALEAQQDLGTPGRSLLQHAGAL